MNHPVLFLNRATRDVLGLYWRLARARTMDLAIPVLLVFVGGAFEALTFGLLVPLTQAVAEG